MDTKPRADEDPFAVPMRHRRIRLSSAHTLIFAAGALAFLANLALLRPDAAPPTIAVAASELLPGAVFDPTRDAEFVPLSATVSVLEEFVVASAADRFAGRVVTSRVAAGSPLLVRDLTPDPGVGRRIMSLPVDRARAVGGRLAVGDLVDVIAVDQGIARYLATGLEVVGVPDTTGSSLTAASSYHLILTVDADTALDLSAAADASELQIVRASGRP